MARLRTRWRRVLLIVLSALLAPIVGFIGLGAAVRAQSLTLPPLSGPNRVGRSTYEWIDSGRLDPLASKPDTPRQLAIWVWYPTADHQAPPAVYLPGPWIGLRPGGFWQHFVQDPDRIHPRALADPLPLPGTHRLVVLEPGLGLAIADLSTLAEQLASHGYVVVGITPTFSANLTVLNGQTIAATNAGKQPNERLVNLWAADDRFAFDQVATIQSRIGVVDTHKVAFVGHSFGGAAAVEACRLESRCVAAADIDGQPFGTAVHTGIPHPLFILGSADLCSHPQCADMAGLHNLVNATRAPTYTYALAGAAHFNFTDLALYHVTPPLRRLLPVGTISPTTALTITSSLLTAFLDHAFGDPDTVNDIAADFVQLHTVHP